MGQNYIYGKLERKIETLLKDYGFPHHAVNFDGRYIVIEDYDNHDPSVGIYGGRVVKIVGDDDLTINEWYIDDLELRRSYIDFFNENYKRLQSIFMDAIMEDYRNV